MRAKEQPGYASYASMMSRCHNPNATGYERYGGRGITVCDRWKEGFWTFHADMGPRPDGASLDRIDTDGPYCPDNCRWATKAEQAQNRRRRTACMKGHPFTDETTYIDPRGKRYCRICRREAQRTMVVATRRPDRQVTHCVHGHELTAENVYIDPKRGTRACLVCRRQRSNQRRVGA